MLKIYINKKKVLLLLSLIPGLGHLLMRKPGEALLWFVAVSVGYGLLIVPGLVLHYACIRSVVK
jgi:hypothetical protein